MEVNYLFMHDDLNCKEITSHSLEKMKIEGIFLKHTITNRKWVILACYYPDTNNIKVIVLETGFPE